MDELHTYLSTTFGGAFQRHELNYVLLFTYNVLKAAARDHADMLCLDATRFTWSREGQPLGEFRIDGRKPTVSFRAMLEQIVARDPMVRRHMELVAESPDELAYRLQDVPVEQAA